MLSLERFPEIGVVRALLRTAYESCVHPMRSAAALPPNPCGVTGWFNSACCYGVAIVFFTIAFITETSSPNIAELLVPFCIWLALVSMCEFILAGLLSITCQKGRFFPHRLRFYRALAHLGSIHTVGFAATYCVTALVIEYCWGGWDSVPAWAEFLRILPFLPFGLWVIHLGTLVVGLGEPTYRVLLVPLLAVISAVAAWIPLAALSLLFFN